MKALGILVRLLCSLAVLIAVALYLQAALCNISPEQFAETLTPESIIALFTSLNWVSITAAALVLLALLRLLDMAWNVLFCLSFIPVLFCGLYAAFGESIALPAPLQGNEYMITFCTLPQSYPVPALIGVGIFALGWLASTAPFRIALSTLISFGLWYGLTFLIHMVIVTRWAETPAPAQPEILTMVLANPWLMAALPGAFFLVYAVLVAFFETFLSAKKHRKPTAASKKEEPAAPAEEKKESPKPEAKPAAASPLSLPKATLKKTAAPTKAEPKKEAETQTAPKTESKPESKPEPKAEPAEATKPEAKAADTPAPTAKAEAKPATETDSATSAAAPTETKTETTPAEAKTTDKA